MTNEMTQTANELSFGFQMMRDYILQMGDMTKEETLRLSAGEIRDRYEYLRSIS